MVHAATPACLPLPAARKQLWADMEQQGLVIKQEPYQVGGRALAARGWGNRVPEEADRRSQTGGGQ